MANSVDPAFCGAWSGSTLFAQGCLSEYIVNVQHNLIILNPLSHQILNLLLNNLGLIVLTLVGHFVSSPREREKRDRRDSRKDEEKDREERGTGMSVKK